LLEAVVQGTDPAKLLGDYRLLRLVESRARWTAGRAVDEIQTNESDLDLLAELVEPGSRGVDLRRTLDAARKRIRAEFESVVSAGSISALTA
jgi:glutamine synthetase adenylyltransferase